MSIVGEKENDHVEYEIPSNIKELITDDFLKEFRNQLLRMHGEYSLDTFAQEGIPVNTSTSGWYAALGKACLLTHNETLLDYWNSLQWYDSDTFDGELAEMLIERHLILGDLFTIIEQQLGIKQDELAFCCDCRGIYQNDMMIKLSDEEAEYGFSKYRCLHCNDLKQTKDKSTNATDYFRECFDEVKEYTESHSAAQQNSDSKE